MANTASQRPATRPRVAYRRILVPVAPGAVATACRLAEDAGSSVVVLAVVEVPAALPLDALMPSEDAAARELLAAAEAIGDRHGVRIERRVVRGRSAGEEIASAADASGAELIVLRRPFDRTARYVLQHARCCVLFSTPPGA
jgi:nucleotide-binding universal stress UspA family protein